MEHNFAFRSQETYEDGKDILCKNPYSENDVNYHVTFASESDDTRFVSLTTRPSVAMYKYGLGKKEKNQRNLMVLIDMQKVQGGKKSEEIYDFTDEATIKKCLRGKAIAYACADREITIDGNIPGECCKKIPPIIEEMIVAIEAKKDGAYHKPLVDTICRLVMNGDIKILENIISGEELVPGMKGPQFNELEKKFMFLYYSEQRPTLESVAKTLFSDVQDPKERKLFVHCIKKDILKKIWDSAAVIGFLFVHLQEEIKNSSDDRKKNYLKNMLKKDFSKAFLANSELMTDESVSACGIQEYSQRGSRYYIANNLFIHFKKWQMELKPEGMEYEYDNDGKIVGATAVYCSVSKNDDPGEPPKEGIEKRKKIPRVIIDKALQVDVTRMQENAGKNIQAQDAGITLNTSQMAESALKDVTGIEVQTVARREQQKMQQLSKDK